MDEETKDSIVIDTEIKNAIKATDKDAQYDESAKRLLGNKRILARILLKTVKEFYGMNSEDVIPYIEGEPFISTIPIEPELTNKKKQEGKRVIGFNSESVESNEGMIRFDLVCYVRIPSKDGTKEKLSQMILNVEAQKNTPASYKLGNRAIFYVSRLISSQKERDFVNTNYDDIKRVISIWICMNMRENSMEYVHLTGDKLLGSYDWMAGIDLWNLVFIGLSRELPEQKEMYELHRLLGALLSRELSEQEKLEILEKEYEIPLEEEIRKDVHEMCNLSQGIKEDGIAIGEAKLMYNMYKKGYSLEQIAEVAEKSIEEVKVVIESKNSISFFTV